ncbi:fatty acid-binding protein DegV [Lottiidibacillus patelloidae]|uniref:Fatty acid-binding protein DegV n=1 Tax=Lottiidibacillus patelloidae TaxID=2670334 RepID=A0A263BPT9_9BACI|nr:DegV family protein [Lottiidibacillus patelloidae]OZM55770.1 fatty acid-binding protein DegV [Lottiidibacillus patelloidae]
MAIRLITDGGADLPESILANRNITIIPLNVMINDITYKSGVELTSEKFYRLMKENETLPKTSSPSPNDFYEAYKNIDENEDVIVIALSSALSSTFESATIGRGMLLEEQPNRNISIVDAKTASVGQAVLVHKACKLIDEGLATADIVSKLNETVSTLNTKFVLDTLENVIKGGRLDKVRGAVASVLNIKLLMEATEDGKVDVVEKVRGTKKALKRLIEQIGECTSNFEEKTLIVAHSNCADRAADVMQKIKEQYPFKELLLAELGPVIGTYAGEGGIVIAYE